MQLDKKVYNIIGIESFDKCEHFKMQVKKMKIASCFEKGACGIDVYA